MYRPLIPSLLPVISGQLEPGKETKHMTVMPKRSLGPEYEGGVLSAPHWALTLQLWLMKRAKLPHLVASMMVSWSTLNM